MTNWLARAARKLVSALGICALLVPAMRQSADAGIFRALFGGSVAPEQRDWSDVTSRKLIPFAGRHTPGTVVVSFADRRLYLVQSGGRAYSYVIGTPKEGEKWSGESWVSDKRIDPHWVPTAEMRAKDPSLPMEMPGGHPRNPLGPRALYLGQTMYRIHGTDAPWTVGHEVSSGCVRLYNADIRDLYSRVPVGAKVVVTWDQFDRSASARNISQRNAASQDFTPFRSY